MKAIFKFEKSTKNTIRFEEVLESELSAPVIGSIYIPKSTLGQIGWKEGSELVLNIEVNA